MTATWPDPLEVPVDRDAAERFELGGVAPSSDMRNVRAEIGMRRAARASTSAYRAETARCANSAASSCILPMADDRVLEPQVETPADCSG